MKSSQILTILGVWICLSVEPTNTLAASAELFEEIINTLPAESDPMSKIYSVAKIAKDDEAFLILLLGEVVRQCFMESKPIRCHFHVESEYGQWYHLIPFLEDALAEDSIEIVGSLFGCAVKFLRTDRSSEYYDCLEEVAHVLQQG